MAMSESVLRNTTSHPAPTTQTGTLRSFRARIAATVAFALVSACKSEPAPEADPEPAHNVAAQAATSAGKDKQCCMGLNDCKGKGGCAVAESHACAGQNECKGKGGCNMHCPK
jgi:hypothetical protein